MFQNSLRYDITDSRLQTLVRAPSSTAASVRCLSQSDCTELVNSGTCQQFLSRFAAEFVPTAYACMPVRLDSQADLVDLLTRFSENSLVTYGVDGDVVGLSCSVSLPLMTEPWHGAVYFHTQYFGEAVQDAVTHVTAQLTHAAAAAAANSSQRSSNVLFRFCFPLCIDSTIASQLIANTVLSGLELLLSEQAYLISVDVDR